VQTENAAMDASVATTDDPLRSQPLVNKRHTFLEMCQVNVFRRT